MLRMLGRVKSIDPRAAALPDDFDFSLGIVWRFPPEPKAFLPDERRYEYGADLPPASPAMLNEHLMR